MTWSEQKLRDTLFPAGSGDTAWSIDHDVVRELIIELDALREWKKARRQELLTLEATFFNWRNDRCTDAEFESAVLEALSKGLKP